MITLTERLTANGWTRMVLDSLKVVYRKKDWSVYMVGGSAFFRRDSFYPVKDAPVVFLRGHSYIHTLTGVVCTVQSFAFNERNEPALKLSLPNGGSLLLKDIGAIYGTEILIHKPGYCHRCRSRL